MVIVLGMSHCSTAYNSCVYSNQTVHKPENYEGLFSLWQLLKLIVKTSKDLTLILWKARRVELNTKEQSVNEPKGTTRNSGAVPSGIAQHTLHSF